MKIVADSSANLQKLHSVDFQSVSLKIITAEREYQDDENLDVQNMLSEMSRYSGPSSTACPNADDWLNAFREETEILCASLTSRLSGCYNSACIAAREYMEQHPGRKVFVLDTLSTGPQEELIVQKYEELVSSGFSFDQITKEIQNYLKKTSLGFMLGNLDNFAKNGRVSPALAKVTGILNIHVVGRASKEGTLEPLNKCAGARRSMKQLWENMLSEGYNGGKVRIRHTISEKIALTLQEMILSQFPSANIKVDTNRGLCSYYAEKGGILVGFEKEPDNS